VDQGAERLLEIPGIEWTSHGATLGFDA
jgi:hypothetical protein